VQDEVNYRCIHAGCARPLPRRVNFCPYCGAAQREGVAKPVHASANPERPFVAPAPTAAPAAAPAAQEPAPHAAPQPAPRGAAAAPPRRQPLRLRYWLLALAALYLVWFYAKPDTKNIEARIARAVALSTECRFNDAQSELIALRSARATPEQLQRLQTAINGAVPACEKKRQRAQAWSGTMQAVDSALAASSFDKAQTRLAAFTRRWGADSETRDLKGRIDARRSERLLDDADACLAKGDLACTEKKISAAERWRRPELSQRIATLRQALAQRAPRDVALSAAQQAQSARNLINDAERELAQGNYKAAADKMEICTDMVDAGNRECIALRASAERLMQQTGQW
jgi:hypothetical protein